MSAPQSVLDSIADAETVRLNDSHWDWIGAARGAILAGQHVTASRIATQDARAAFLAVPDLRIEAPIVTVCQSCGRVKGGRPIPEGAQLSHGICPDCWAPTREAAGLKPKPYSGGAW